MEDLHSEEFDYLFYRDQHLWVRWWIVTPTQNLTEAVMRLRAERGPNVPMVLIHHPPHYPLAATSYGDDGLRLYMQQMENVHAKQETNPIGV